MRILILGGDGYLGWPTAMYLSEKGHDVGVVDNFIKRKWESEVGSSPLIPIRSLHNRVKLWESLTGNKIKMWVRDITESKALFSVIEEFIPDTIIHYAEQPSAPYSMQGVKQASDTQFNNVIGTLHLLFAMKKLCPNSHLIKLGTMGEYGTPNIDIEEGYLEVEHKGRKDTFLFPKNPGSFYHLSKVHDSHNIYFACKIWGLKATDLNQGVVYGIETKQTKYDEGLSTSFHYDECFGTALNRFCIQAVSGNPITPYGKGNQTRGFLNILDTLQCVEIAANNPPNSGVMEVYNQFTEVFSINQLANIVLDSASKLGMNTKIVNIDNPRKEMEDHYYNPVHTKLTSLGLKPNKLSDVLVDSMLLKIQQYKYLIDVDSLHMGVRWDHQQ